MLNYILVHLFILFISEMMMEMDEWKCNVGMGYYSISCCCCLHLLLEVMKGEAETN